MNVKILLAFLVLIVAASCNKPSPAEDISAAEVADEKVNYNASDLQKIKWIEGNWKGMDGENPFYELYKFTNDSTIEIISYTWNGTDSSKSSKDFLTWQDDAHYLGKQKNYKVTSISEDSVAMIPYRRGGNTIVWKRNPEHGWDAILKTKNVTKEYKMERVSHFQE